MLEQLSFFLHASHHLCLLFHLCSMEMLAPFSALPAIMCSRGVSNGPWLSFPPPFPFHFLITSPPALSHWSSDKIIPLLFSPSTPSHTSWLKHDPKEAGNGHLQYSFLSLALCLSCTICLSPPPTRRTHLEQVTDHFKHLECSEAITLPSGYLQPPCRLSLLDFERTLLYYLHSSHKGESPVVMLAQDSHHFQCWCTTFSLSAQWSSPCSWSAEVLSAHQGATVLVICRSRTDRKMEAETRGHITWVHLRLARWISGAIRHPSPRSVCFSFITLPLSSAPHHVWH